MFEKKKEMRFACAVDNCSNNYAQSAGLKTHQRKAHPESFKEFGVLMKRIAAEETNGSVFVKKLKTQDVDQSGQNDSIAELRAEIASLREELRVVRLTDETFQLKINSAVKPMIDTLNSEVFAHVTNLQDQMVLLAKKNVKYCVVCFERENNFAFMPCRHKCVCRQCAQLVINKYKKCPICRNEAVNAQAIYDTSAWEIETT